MDFRSPSIKEIADFLLYLFQEKNLQPSTIDGYRTAIADKIRNDKINISKDENLTHLLDSFHKDKWKEGCTYLESFLGIAPVDQTSF